MYFLCLPVTDGNLYISLAMIFNTELIIIYCTILKGLLFLLKCPLFRKFTEYTLAFWNSNIHKDRIATKRIKKIQSDHLKAMAMKAELT